MRGMTIWSGSLVALLGLAGAAGAADVVVEVQGITRPKGHISVALYTSGKDFPKPDLGLHRVRVPAAAPTTRIVIADVPHGRYAIALFHDENDNEKLDRNQLGIPVEGFGFSRDAVGFMGAPSFDKAAVQLDGTGTLVIRLRY